MNDKNDKISRATMGKLKVIAVFLVLFGIIAVLFSSTKTVAVAYLACGSAAIFSTIVYLQIYFSRPKQSIPVLKDEDYPSLAVLVPNWNYERTLDRALGSIVNMKYPKPFEIIVIDDCSTDNSAETIQKFADKYPSIRFVKNKKNMGKAASLNNALKMTNAEIVACIDSDTYPPEDALLKMIPHFYNENKGSNVGAVTGFITTAEPKNFIQRIQELEYFNAFGFVPKMMVNINGLMVAPGPMSLFKRKVLLEIGGYDEKNLTEDMEIGLKLQKNHYSIGYCSDVVIPTEVPDTLKKLYRQRQRWYRGTIFNLEKYKEMALNKNYGHFGVFSYPACLIYVIFTIFTFSILAWQFGKDIILRAQILASALSVSSNNLISYVNYANYIDIWNMPFLFNSVFVVLFLFFTIFWVFCLYNSMKIAKAKFRLSHLPTTVVILFLYPLMVSIFYVVSFFKEIYGSGMEW